MTDGWRAQGHNHKTVIHRKGSVSVHLLLAVASLVDILVTEGDDKVVRWPSQVF